MDKTVAVLVLIALVSAAGFFAFQEQPAKKNFVHTGLSIAKTFEPKPICEIGNVKGLKTVNVYELNGSEYFLCSENGIWTGPHQSTNSVKAIDSLHKIA